jgi:hypothetical protein
MRITDDLVGGIITAAIALPLATVSVVFGGVPLIIWSTAVFVTVVAAGLGTIQSRRARR